MLETFDSILALATAKWNGQIIVSRDFNINLLRKIQITEIYSETLKHQDLIQHIEKPTRSGKQLIYHSVFKSNKSASQNVLPRDEISDQDAPDVIADIRKRRFEPRYKYTRDEKPFNSKAFKESAATLPFCLVYAMND